ncbi:chromosome segregation protein SMC [Candidatus Woesearchaeota archaeon]|nr:chromosome segregation protein SMC [Candidatus Woesearchaeota archaeon]
MTLIKSVVAKGFKSFAKRTELIFGEGYNSIIGPNGSGKSNIIDAITFVLGKTSAKSLRAEKSSNLIHHGGKKGKPSPEAEVSITFDNSQNAFPLNSKEIKISRIVKQNGNSTYRINDKVVTRQQVIELLYSAKIDPDGHNIILQGDIIRFMEMKPEHRREIIEEVSGLSVFEDKKAKALNELSRVDEKLKEVDIILTERDTYLKELKKDRDHALKYKELQNTIKDNKATFLNLEIKEKELKREEFEKKIKENNNELEKINKVVNEIKLEIEKKKQEINSISKELEEKGEVEQRKLHNDIDSLKTSLVRDNSRKETCEQEITKIENRKKQLERNIREIEDKIKDLDKERQVLIRNKKDLTKEDDEILNSINSYKKKYNINPEELNKIENSIENIQSNINSSVEKKQEKLREIDRINFELSNIKIDDNKDEISRIKDLRQNQKLLLQELNKIIMEEQSLHSQLNKTRNLLVEKSENLFRLNARQEGVQERLIDNIAIKKILSLKDSKIYGTVNDLGKVNSKYSLALEVAAGSRIRSVVVEDDLTASKCINLLRQNKLGVVTFLPLNKLKNRDIDSQSNSIKNKKGVIDLAINLVSFEEKFRNVFNYVFGATLVVDNLEIARSIGIGNARMVTLEGDLVEISGAMVGGYRKKGVGFKEKEYTEDISKLGIEVEELKKKVNLFEKRKLEIEAKIIEIREKASLNDGELLKYEKAFGLVDINELKSRKQNLNEELKSKNKELKEIENDLIRLAKEIEKLKDIRKNIRYDDKAVDGLNKLERDRQHLRERIVEIESNVKGLNTQINDIYSIEKEKTSKIISDSEKEKQSFIDELKSLSEKLKNDHEKLKQKDNIEKQFNNDFKNLFSKRNKINEEVNKKEANISKEEEKIKAVEHRINNINIERAKIVAELEGLNREFEQFTDAKIRRNISFDDLKYEIKKAESLLNNLGNVNLRALEIYENVEKEYNNLVDKKDKLSLEKNDVFSMINEIESRKKDIFMKTFKVINDNFRRIFASLSTKGEAHLELEDKEVVFNGGMDIKVRIIGNKFLDIKSLSGGEKTLAALAFIFAIQEYQPASFYLLDEVDAALDKTNSELLNNLIQKYSEKAQYIVVTHNDAIISGANYIYGVSMQNEITKVVSLKV